MFALDYLAVAVTAVAAIILSSVWYTIFDRERMKLLGNDPNATADMRKVQPWKLLGEFIRTLVVAYVLARLIMEIGVNDLEHAVGLAVLLWIGFPFMILVGSVTWDRRPWKLAAIHAGDWLFKLIAMALILSSWR